MVEQVNFYVKKLVEEDPQNPLGDVPRLPISLEFHPTQLKIDVQLNIDSYLTYKNRVVFKLPMEQQTSPRKQFCVITEIKYCDEVQARRVKSPPFLVTTTPLSPQKQQQVPTNVAATQDEEIEREVALIYEAVNYIPLISESKEIFKCLICLRVATSPVFMSCCDQMIGCYHCYAQWAESSIMCLHCRSVEGKTVKNDKFNKIITLIRGPDEAE